MGTGRVNSAYYCSKGDARLVYLLKFMEVRWFTVVRSQFVSRQREGEFCVW
jgi:hypothetical protein